MVKIKICGLFRDIDADLVNEAVPDFIGFVFAKSRRQVAFEQARKMRGRLHPSIIPVGVFMDESVERIRQLYLDGVIGIAQLHGHEDESYIRKLKELCGVPVIKAIQVKATEDILKWRDSAADYLLLDSGCGTGKTFDWKLIPEIKTPYFLAGGIGEGNIKAALSLAPYCIDVSSGVETNGTKDSEKIKRMVELVRNYSRPALRQ